LIKISSFDLSLPNEKIANILKQTIEVDKEYTKEITRYIFQRKNVIRL
jgi:hypothetical protein